MIFDEYDFEFLRLCGLCRYLPVGIQTRYDAPFFKRSVISTLKERGLIKVQSDKLSYKLTYDGREFLKDMGHTFPDDVRMDLKRPAYKRKLKNALWNITLSLAGIDVYHNKTRELAEIETGYVSSLTLRSDNSIRVLAGTRFLGILKIRNTAYVPYYLENDAEWIIPGYEREIYKSQIETIADIKEIKLILTGESLEELWAYIHPGVPSEKLSRGMKRFDVALEELGCEYLLIPYNRDGVIQLGFLKSARNGERLAKALGCNTEKIPHLSECDGTLNDTPCVIAIDFNVKRIVRALKQIERVDKNTIPLIYCLPFQKKTIFKLLHLYGCQDSRVLTISRDNIYNVFPEFEKDIVSKNPFMTKEGKYIDANIRKYQMEDNEKW